ncbi:aldehyde dehydrogenase family protein [Arthrobacter sp. MI7-26]|uniref:aldehyde dehydrogenase family protein n=1 Tax=Arthrobacter sp. MI7-26 TaxID=2993653 RepID=UPI0022489088|nr:aldehyde dehydrogenase family protein [Arthrobacter sp. MI7-26]MCX2750022.1 aldehyde dehydrogenase family protein [Arthrobacter sp. MI7-26]
MGTIQSIDPATGIELLSFEEDSDDIVDNKLEAAKAALPLLSAADWGGRAVWMRSAAALLESEIEDVALLITKEMGKPIAQSRAEVLKSANAMRFYADHAEEFLAGRELESPEVVNATAAGTRYEPLGVVLAVMPWNYPIWQVVRFAAPALMAGNAGVLKHASNVPQSAIYIGELFTRAGFPEGSFATLLIGSYRVAAVIRDKRIAAVTLTGSEEAGRSVAATAGDVLKKAVLELGGSDPFIVMPTADIDAAVDTAVKARISNNGQACINAKRFIVHEDIFDEFTGKFTERMSSLIVGDPSDPATEVGPLATESGRRDVTDLVEDARGKGAEIITGSSPSGPDGGWYFPPTVVTGLTPEMRLWEEEAFGPVASVYCAANLDEALRLANALEFGLGSAFWSNDEVEIDRAVRDIEAGAVFVNGMTISYAELPFGGIKRSGYGRELSMEGIREFCNLKTVWKA